MPTYIFGKLINRLIKSRLYAEIFYISDMIDLVVILMQKLEQILHRVLNKSMMQIHCVESECAFEAQKVLCTVGWALQHQVCDPNFYHFFCCCDWSFI